MRAMILAAGRGERMGALTENCPKPLIKVAGMALIEYHVRALAAANIRELVINTAYLGEQIEDALGNGDRFGVHIEYSREGSEALETGGGICKALPLLGERPFAVVNGDIWSDFPYESLRRQEQSVAHLVMVRNPEHNRGGDFGLHEGLITPGHDHRYTFSGIGVYEPAMFADCEGAFKLAPLLRKFIDEQQVTGSLFDGYWFDVGNVKRLHAVEMFLSGAAFA